MHPNIVNRYSFIDIRVTAQRHSLRDNPLFFCMMLLHFEAARYLDNVKARDRPDILYLNS